MESVNFYDFLNVKGLLVKCSEAGNVTAQHVLGKVILLSSTHLLHSEGKLKVFGVSPCDRLKLKRLILDKNVRAHSKVSSFMSYFSRLQVRTSDSPTRLVHHQLVKLFLINGNHDDFIEMGIFLRLCIQYLMSDTRELCLLNTFITKLVRRARYVGDLAKAKESFNDCFKVVREILELHPDNYFDKISGKYRCLRHLCLQKCHMADLGLQEALSDENFVEELRQEVSDQLGQSYIDLSTVRAMALDRFEDQFE
ncbi:uncharacterized protein LOC108223558 [Daucus carota subsp. sativus]